MLQKTEAVLLIRENVELLVEQEEESSENTASIYADNPLERLQAR